MKCERCGNQLDDTDLFCQKCGKAVFEEYMDDDDIWDEYDREPKVGFERKIRNFKRDSTGESVKCRRNQRKSERGK